MLKTKIFNAAVSLARKHGLTQLTRFRIATESGAAEATVSYYYGSMDEIRAELIEHALQHEIVEILAHAHMGKAIAKGRIPPALMTRVVKHIASR